MQTLCKLLLLTITLTTLLAQDMYRPPYESTLNIDPRAKQWYKDAAVDGEAAYEIALVYQIKLNNIQRAKQWYHYAWSLKEYKYTANNLGYIYEDLKEYDKAKQWYEKAIERESESGMFNLALLYDEHYKEYDKAIELYKKAHEMGHYGAAGNLGHLYANTLKDYDNAKIWYQKGIDIEDEYAVINMGWLYYKTNDSVRAAAYMFNAIVYFSNGSKTKEKQELKETIEFLKDEWNLDDQTIQKGYELQLTMDNLPKKYRGGVR